MSQITLEMVDEVINRTGASYTEAKEALQSCDGDILEAVVLIETNREASAGFSSDFSERTHELLEKAKEVIKKGNVTSIVVERHGRKLLDIPMTVGGIAAVLFIWQTIIGVIAAFGTGCVLKVIKDNGEVININDLVYGKVDDIVEKAEEIKDKFKGKDYGTDFNEKFDNVEDADCSSQAGDEVSPEGDESKDEKEKAE
jgi:hypothetical protein